MQNQEIQRNAQEADRENGRWLSVDEIAQHLGVSNDTVYTWLAKKKIPAHRLGKLWKFKISEVDLWIKSGEAAN